MEIQRQCLAYFSATRSTRSVVRLVAKETGIATSEEYDITNPKEELTKKIELRSSDLLIVGVPSFSGRVPAIAIPLIDQFKGNNTPAIILCTYGNRDYDDTLLELKDLVSKNGFKVVSAGAFVAKHSIFPKVATDRPSDEDKEKIKTFTHSSMQLIEEIKCIDNIPDLQVKGHFPYREVKKIPLRPTGNRKCDNCGVCVHMCPTEAIPSDTPRKTDKEKCIACARCIAVCPQNARAFRGLLYKLVSRSFVKKHQEQQSNIVSYIGAEED